MATQRHPWERIPPDPPNHNGEGVKAFRGFEVYLMMGPERTLRAVAAQLSKTPTHIAEWSARWGWVDRAAAWDEYIRAEQRATVERMRIEWAETQELARLQAQMQGVQLGRKAAAVGGKILEMPLVERVEEGVITCECGRKHPQTVHIHPHPDVKISDAPRLLKVGLDSQRQALGMSLGRHEVDHTIEVEDDVIDRAIDLMPPDVAALYLAAKAEKQDAILRPYLERAAAGEAAGEPASSPVGGAEEG